MALFQAAGRPPEISRGRPRDGHVPLARLLSALLARFCRHHPHIPIGTSARTVAPRRAHRKRGARTVPRVRQDLAELDAAAHDALDLGERDLPPRPEHHDLGHLRASPSLWIVRPFLREVKPERDRDRHLVTRKRDGDESLRLLLPTPAGPAARAFDSVSSRNAATSTSVCASLRSDHRRVQVQ